MLNESKQIKIGLTGGIGSGKTFVGEIFSKFNIPVFNADTEAKICMVEDHSLKQSIKNVFGDEIYKDGILENKILAQIVFNDKKKLEELNQLVHPVVKRRFKDWCATIKAKIVIKEAAILFESDSHLELDKVICILAPEEIRIDRVIKRDKTSIEQVLVRVERQISQDEKQKLSDFVIINDEVELLLPQIIEIISKIS